jgi:A/G-specific adenine glycosylase
VALAAPPGIGPYTARAIASTAFGSPVTALDVNARRVVGRLLDGAALPVAPSPTTQARADAMAPARHADVWNHALMDLGAAVCRPVPDCGACPVRRWCAFAAGGAHDATATPGPRRPGAPFHATNRYVRGRVLAVLRDAPTGSWTVIDAETLALEPHRVEHALQGLADEGLVERRVRPGRPSEARLPTT